MNATVVHIPNPFAPSSSRELIEVAQPMTVREYLDERGIDEFDRPTIAIYNGEGLMRAQWATTTLAGDDVLAFVTLPQGGDRGTDPLRTVLMLALVIGTQGLMTPEALGFTAAENAAGVMVFSTGAKLATGMAQMATIMGGSALINALLPPQTPDAASLPSPTYTLSARNNRPRPREVVPVLYGRHLIVPDFAETPYTEFSGQTEIVRGSLGNAAQQHLYQVFCLGQGPMVVNDADIKVGETAVEGFDDVEFEVLQPGEQITLVPQAVEVSSEVSGLRLPGVGDKPSTNASEFGESPGSLDIQAGQVSPADWTQAHIATNAAGSTYTATGGEGNALLSAGVTYGVLDMAGAGWASTGNNDLAGQVVYIGGATPGVDGNGNMGREGSDGWDISDRGGIIPPFDFTDPELASSADKLVHPDRIRTIYANTSTRLYVRGTPDSPLPWHASYTPTNGTEFHLRDDWVGPYPVNSAETTTNRFSVDVTGSPLYWHDGGYIRWGMGLRFEYRKIDDDGVPDTGAAGQWTRSAPEFSDWGRVLHKFSSGFNTMTGAIGPDTAFVQSMFTGSHRATTVLYGTGFELNPLAISFSFDVPEGRYEIRARRTTCKFVDSSKYSNEVRWDGLRAHLTSADRNYEGVTILAMAIKASGDINSSNYQQVSVVATRKLPIYQGDAFSTSLPADSTQTTEGSSRVKIHHPDHGLPTGAAVALGGLSTTGGVSAGELNATHTITRVIESGNSTDYYTVTVATLATGTATSGGGTATGAGGWTTERATQNPAWALADSVRSTVYSIGLADSRIDLDGLIVLANLWEDRGDKFNAVFDQQSGLLQAAALIARAGRARIYLPDGKLTVLRDQTQPLRTAMFSNRNIARGSMGISYRFDSDETPDSVEIDFMDEGTWKPRSVHAYLYDGGDYSAGQARRNEFQNPDNRKVKGDSTNWLNGVGAGDALVGGKLAFSSEPTVFYTITKVVHATQLLVDPPIATTISNNPFSGNQDYTITKAGNRSKPARMTLFGVTDREQAWREGMYSVADAKYRRRTISFDTDYEGHLVQVSDKIAVTHDLVNLAQQSGDVTGYETATGVGPYLTTSEPLVWEGGDNIITNGGFETDTTGWGMGGSNTSKARITTDAQTGTACLEMSKAAAGTSTWLSCSYSLTALAGTAKDTVMTARAWVKAGNANAVGEKVQFTLRESGSSTVGTYEESDGLDWTLTDEWQEVVTTYRIQQSDSTATQLYFVMGSAANMKLLADNVRVYKGPFVVTLKGDLGQPVGPTTCYPIIDYTQSSRPFRNGTVRANEMELLSVPGFTPTTELGTREPTAYSFGSTSSWTTDAIVTAVIPRGQATVQVNCVNEDERVHTADDETYIGTLDVQGLAATPDAPAVTGLTAHLRGDVGNRQVSASWLPAAGATGYEVEHGDSLAGRSVAVSGGVITDGPIQDGETLRAYSATSTDFSMYGSPAVGSQTFQITIADVGLVVGSTVDIFVSGLGWSGIPSSELNGHHSAFVATTSPTSAMLEFSTTTGSGTQGTLVQLFPPYPNYRLATGASGTAVGAGNTGDAFVGYDSLAGEFAFGDFIAGDTSSAYFTDGSQGGSRAAGAWTVVGWTSATSISAAYLSTATVGEDETVYVRARATGLLRGDWMTATATGTNATAAVTFDVTTGAIVAGGNAAQIQYSLAGWFTHLDDTDPSIGVVQTSKILGELPANHIVKGIEMRLVEVFNSSGVDIQAVGHTDTTQVNEYGQMFADGSAAAATPGVSIDEFSATARTADITYLRSGSAPTEGKLLVILTYVVVPPEPTV